MLTLTLYLTDAYQIKNLKLLCNLINFSLDHDITPVNLYIVFVKNSALSDLSKIKKLIEVISFIVRKFEKKAKDFNASTYYSLDKVSSVIIEQWSYEKFCRDFCFEFSSKHSYKIQNYKRLTLSLAFEKDNFISLCGDERLEVPIKVAM